MDSKQSSDHAQESVQEDTTANDDAIPHQDPQIPWLEQFLMKIGFFEYKYNAIIMACVALAPFLFEYLICRRYCDIDDCFFYRKTASRCTDIMIVLYFLRVRYSAWSRGRQQTTSNTNTTSSQSDVAI